MRQFTNRLHLINFRKRDEAYQRLADEWAIKANGVSQPTEQLSGGNQQKVVLARSVASEPQVLVLINPTAGVDVQAKNSIYSTIDSLKQRGQSVLVVTSDDGDLEICDRILVMFHGEVISELHPPYSERGLAAAVQGADVTVPRTRPRHGRRWAVTRAAPPPASGPRSTRWQSPWCR
jgi:simple sugar transport system ATP-binding protein